MVSVEVHYGVEKIGFKRQMKAVEDTEMRVVGCVKLKSGCTFILIRKKQCCSGIGVSDSDVEFRSGDCHKIAAEYLPRRTASAETCLEK